MGIEDKLSIQLARYRIAAGKRRAFRRSVAVDDLGVRQLCESLSHVRHGKRFAADQQLLYFRQGLRLFVDHRVKQRRRQP